LSCIRAELPVGLESLPRKNETHPWAEKFRAPPSRIKGKREKAKRKTTLAAGAACRRPALL
jgi:hypothetical protein